MSNEEFLKRYDSAKPKFTYDEMQENDSEAYEVERKERVIFDMLERIVND